MNKKCQCKSNLYDYQIIGEPEQGWVSDLLRLYHQGDSINVWLGTTYQTCNLRDLLEDYQYCGSVLVRLKRDSFILVNRVLFDEMFYFISEDGFSFRRDG